jgi:hypothetical protein
LVELDFKRTTTGSCYIYSAPGVVLAETRWSGYGENFFNNHSGFDLSTNNLGLAVYATEGRDNEQRDSVIVSRNLEIAPSFRSIGDKQMISSINFNLCNFKAAGLFANMQATSHYQFT